MADTVIRRYAEQLDAEIVDEFMTELVSAFEGAYRQSSENMQEHLLFTEEMSTRAEITKLPFMDAIAEGMKKFRGSRNLEGFSRSEYKLYHDRYHRGWKIEQEAFEENFGKVVGSIDLGSYSLLARTAAAAISSFQRDIAVEALVEGGNRVSVDGQNFFDTHDFGANQATGGGGEYWYLADLSGPVKPIILLERQAPTWTPISDLSMVYMYGYSQLHVDARYGTGYGLPYTMFRSNETLTADNLKAARAAMRSWNNSAGAKLGVTPTHLIVGESNENAAWDLLNQEFVVDSGAAVDNTMANTSAPYRPSLAMISTLP